MSTKSSLLASTLLLVSPWLYLRVAIGEKVSVVHQGEDVALKEKSCLAAGRLTLQEAPGGGSKARIQD